MKVKNAIKNACSLLELNSLAEELEGISENSSVLSADLAAMRLCAEMVVNEVAGEYFGLTDEFKTYTDGSIEFSKFPKQVFSVLGVYLNGVPVKFKLLGEKLITTPGNIKIKYTYTYEALKITSEVEFPEGFSRILGYGIAAEYCLIKNMFDEAVMWDKKYRDAVRSASSGRRRDIARRRWM